MMQRFRKTFKPLKTNNLIDGSRPLLVHLYWLARPLGQVFVPVRQYIYYVPLRASSGFLDLIGFFFAEPLTEKDPVVGTCVP